MSAIDLNLDDISHDFMKTYKQLRLILREIVAFALICLSALINIPYTVQIDKIRTAIDSQAAFFWHKNNG